MKYIGGYSILDLTDANVSAQANVCYNQDKPVLVYGANGEKFFADTITKSGTSIIITKGGKTITIANDNTITNVGDIDDVIKVYNQVSGKKLYDDFYDFDKDITISSLPSGLTCYYAHARISNGKLNIVIAFNSTTGENIASSSSITIGELGLSSDVLDKLIPYVSVNLSTKYGYITAGSWQSTAKTILQVIKSTNKIQFNITQEADTNVSSSGDLRFEFNFLL